MINQQGVHKFTKYDIEQIDENRTKLTRSSPFGSGPSTMEFNIPAERFQRYYAGEGNVQELFPELCADDREFIMTGITPDEWPAEI